MHKTRGNTSVTRRESRYFYTLILSCYKTMTSTVRHRLKPPSFTKAKAKNTAAVIPPSRTACFALFYLLTADTMVLLDPVERVVHKPAVAPTVVRVAVYQFLLARGIDVTPRGTHKHTQTQTGGRQTERHESKIRECMRIKANARCSAATRLGEIAGRQCGTATTEANSRQELQIHPDGDGAPRNMPVHHTRMFFMTPQPSRLWYHRRKVDESRNCGDTELAPIGDTRLLFPGRSSQMSHPTRPGESKTDIMLPAARPTRTRESFRRGRILEHDV